jgi:hypothetical protein
VQVNPVLTAPGPIAAPPRPVAVAAANTPPPAPVPQATFRPATFEPAPPPAPAPAKIVPVDTRRETFAEFAPEKDAVSSAPAFEASTRTAGSSKWMLTTAAIVGVVALGGYAAWAGMKGGDKAAPVEAPAVTTGTLVISTEPAGAHASVDGEDRGTTPLTLTLPAGAHTVRLRGAYGDERSIAVAIKAGGSVNQYVDLAKESTPPPVVTKPAAAAAAAAAATADEAPAAGWVTLRTRFEVTVYEKGLLLASSQTEKIMLPAGKHEFELVNEAIGYRATKSVQVAQGKVATLSVDAPTGSLSVNAQPWAEVWIDGDKVGETPIGNLTLPIGSHDVVFKHPELGEQHQTALVTLKAPARISADLRKK